MKPFFAGTRPGHSTRVGTSEIELPVLYFRDDSFAAAFSADMKSVRELMPSRHLQPIPARPGRALILISAFDYLVTSAGPYGEVAVMAPVVYGDRAPPPILPTLLESRWPGQGMLVLHLPVTEKLARDAGRDLWGFAKFVADMEFDVTPESLECRLEEDGKMILSLRVPKRGIVLPDRQPDVTYSVKDRTLVRTTIEKSALARTSLGGREATLDIGSEHPVARSLRALDLDPRPLFTRYWLERAMILREGEVVERDVRPLDGYFGAEREHGILRDEHPPVFMVH